MRPPELEVPPDGEVAEAEQPGEGVVLEAAELAVGLDHDGADVEAAEGKLGQAPQPSCVKHQGVQYGGDGDGLDIWNLFFVS